MVKKKSHKDFYYELKAQNSQITILGIYKDYNSKIAAKCNTCSWEWFPTESNLLHGHGCPKCEGTKQKSYEEFVKDLKSKRNDVVIIDTYVKAIKKAKFRFLKCGHECNISPAHILSGRGCPACARSHRGESQRMTMEKFLERLHKIDLNLGVREGGIYNNRTLMPLHCNACGYKYEISAHQVMSTRGCPNCHKAGTSFLEQFIYHSFVHILGKAKVKSREKNVSPVCLSRCPPYFDSSMQPTDALLNLKMMEGVYILLNTDKNLYASLFDFTEPWKINILDFLEKNYMNELSMEEIANYTGRSLATFKRDFAKISELTPQKWIIKRRLEAAHEMIRSGGKKVSEVCFDVGFKNLSHFSKIYKEAYGIAPTK